MKKSTFIILLLITVTLLTGCKKKTTNEVTKKENVSNLYYTEIFKNNEEILFEVTNSNEFSVDIEFFIDYLTNDDEEVDIGYDYVDCIGANETAYVGLDLPSDDYDKYKIELTGKKSELKNLKSSIEYKVNDKEDLSVTITNTLDQTIDNVSYYTIFKKKGQIVGYDESFKYKLGAKDKKTSIIYPYYEGIKENKYDDISIKINEAYTK